MTQQRTEQEIEQEIKELEAELKKANEEQKQKRHIVCDENSSSYCSHKGLYEWTNALLEAGHIEKRILWLEKDLLRLEIDEIRTEKDALWNELYLGECGEPPADDQPLVYLTDNVIQFPVAKEVGYV